MAQGTNEPIRCETCNTAFASLDDFELHAREDHPVIPARLATSEKAKDTPNVTRQSLLQYILMA
jgi:hypothetical protein